MTAYILDAVVILIFVLSAVIGHKRGLIKTLSKAVAFLLAFIIALLLCGPAASLTFDTFMAPSIEKNITEKLTDSQGNITEGLDEAIDGLPSFIGNALANQGIRSGKDITDRVTDIGGKPETVAEEVTRTVVRPVAVSLLRVICLLVLFLIVFLIVLLLMKVLDVIAKLPGLKALNKGLGFVAGAVTGLVLVAVAISVLQAIAASGAPDAPINPSVLDNTHVIKWLIGINPVGDALQELMAVTGK